LGLRLHIPDASAPPGADVETRPPQVERWLSNLPVLNVAANMQQIRAALHALNRHAVAPDTRLRLLETYRPTVDFISGELRNQLKVFSLPLSEKNQRLADEERAMHEEMATGYKLVVMAQQQHPRADDPDQVLALQRALRYLASHLLKCYEYYHPSPEGAWLEIHQLFGHAVALGVADRRITDAHRPAQPETVARSYKHALLLGLSNPYQQPFHMVDKVQAFLGRWADLAQLLSEPRTQKKKCQFLVHPDEDRPGIPFGQEPDRDGLVLDTRPLVREVHLQLTALNTGVVPEGGLPADFYDEMARAMLQRMVVCWGINPIRRFSRSRGEGSCNLAVGVETVNYFLNGEHPFELSHLSEKEEIELSSTGASFTRRRVHPDEESHRSCNWGIVDESACGFGLATEQTQACNVRVGDLVAVRTEDGGDWTVGLIRWIRSPGNTRIEAGVQKVAPSARPVAVSAIQVDGEGDDYRPAVLLPEIPALQQPRSVIAPKGVYRAERNLFLDTGDHLLMIRAKRAIESTPSADWFEFEELEI